jgi:hypothetical protein
MRLKLKATTKPYQSGWTKDPENGWLSPEGDFNSCGVAGHYQFAFNYLFRTLGLEIQGSDVYAKMYQLKWVRINTDRSIMGFSCQDATQWRQIKRFLKSHPEFSRFDITVTLNGGIYQEDFDLSYDRATKTSQLTDALRHR